jgi:hypothetical protein
LDPVELILAESVLLLALDEAKGSAGFTQGIAGSAVAHAARDIQAAVMVAVIAPTVTGGDSGGV